MAGKKKKKPLKLTRNELSKAAQAVEGLQVTIPQLLEMIQQQAITNMQLKALNDAVINEMVKFFDVIYSRLCDIEDKVFGENKGKLELPDGYLEAIRLTKEQADELKAKIESAIGEKDEEEPEPAG